MPAFDRLYNDYSGPLYGVVKRILRNDQVAEELLTDLFLKIWDNIGSFDESKGCLLSWMMKIARNHAIDKFRSREMSEHRKTVSINKLITVIDHEDSSELIIDTIGFPELLMKLRDDQRFIIDCIYFKGYTQSELAEEFKIPLGTVKTRTRLALKELRLTLIND